jgi:hypothetical protein
MPSVRENLIAARALIDTPEKWAVLSITGAMSIAAPSPEAHGAITDAMTTPFRLLGYFERSRSTTHADMMALFDRAIAAQETSDAK